LIDCFLFEMGEIIAKKRYLSAVSLLAYGLVFHEEKILRKFVPHAISESFTRFQYKTGITPFSTITAPVVFCVSYLVLIFVLKYFMKNREKYDLFWIRVVHNFILTLGSLLLFLGAVKESFLVYEKYGSESLFCDRNSRQKEGNLYFWYYIFFLSKFYEFIDTFLLILLKKETTFLHCFHHFITAFLCWMGLYFEQSVQWVIVIANTSVHTVMYYYYLATTVKKEYRPWWKEYITQAQIVQFIFDLVLCSPWFYFKHSRGLDCSGNTLVLAFANLILLSFVFLFMNFFFRAYRRGKDLRLKKE